MIPSQATKVVLPFNTDNNQYKYLEQNLYWLDKIF